jgi:hypothetical protein
MLPSSTVPDANNSAAAIMEPQRCCMCSSAGVQLVSRNCQLARQLHQNKLHATDLP